MNSKILMSTAACVIALSAIAGCGTNPTNALSVLRIARSTTNSGLLQFVAQTNLGYTVQYRTNLSSALWRPLSHFGVQTQVNTMQVSAPNPPPEPERFYRVVTPPVP